MWQVGQGQLVVTFAPDAPLGISIGPLIPPDAPAALAAEATEANAKAEENAEAEEEADVSLGYGAEVGEVEADGAAAAAGVTERMMIHHLRSPDLIDLNGRRYEDILGEIDRRDCCRLLRIASDCSRSAGEIRDCYRLVRIARDRQARLLPTASDCSVCCLTAS